MDGFARRRTRKKKAILKAAQNLFSRSGVKNSNIADIAREAEVSQVTIYNYFGSKEGLVREVVLEMMEDKWKEFEALISSEIPFPEKIQEMVDNKSQTTREFEKAEFLDPVFFQDPVVKEYIDRFYQERTIPSVRKLISQGRKEGYLPPFISDEAILAYLARFKDIAQDQEIMAPGKKKLRQDITYLFFYGLFGNKPGERGK